MNFGITLIFTFAIERSLGEKKSKMRINVYKLKNNDPTCNQCLEKKYFFFFFKLFNLLNFQYQLFIFLFFGSDFLSICK